jgi:hypothetical protein
MPTHDWSKVDRGLFHHFHVGLIARLSDQLNGASLPAGFYALIEKRCPPQDADPYAAKASRIVIRHPMGNVVAIIEIVSPGNKESVHALRSFVQKGVEFLRQGISLLIVDLFPPSKRDPEGIHKAIWDEIRDEPFSLPRDKPLTLAAYDAGPPIAAFVETLGIGDTLPPMALFLAPGTHVVVPLEATYEATWNVCPEPLKEAVVSGDQRRE